VRSCHRGARLKPHVGRTNSRQRPTNEDDNQKSHGVCRDLCRLASSGAGRSRDRPSVLLSAYSRVHVRGRPTQVNPVLAHRRISRVRLRSILDSYRQLVVVGREPVAPTVNRGRMGKGASRALDPTLQLTIRFDGIGPWATGFRSLHQRSERGPGVFQPTRRCRFYRGQAAQQRLQPTAAVRS
jgi:hypothetical protein